MNISPKSISRTFVLSLLVSVFAGPGWAQGLKKIDFSRLVVVGDSLAAGVENESLEARQQEHGFASVIARHALAPLVLPLVPYPGAPNSLELISAGFPPVIQPQPGTLYFPRLNPFAEVTDVAVPLQTVADALNRKPTKNLQTTDETQLATDIVLGYPCPILLFCPGLTQVQHAIALHPTTVIVDIGNNDILGAVTSGQLGTLLNSPSTFLTSFNASYSSLLSQLAATGATLIVGNIPDVMEAPYFIPLSKLAVRLNLPVSTLASLLGLGQTDYVTLDALPTIEAILSNPSLGPLPTFCTTSPTTPCVVNATEAAAVRGLTVAMNVIIATQTATRHGVPVDLFSLVDTLSTSGYPVGNQTLTTDFLGGLFSLDGLHPTNTGYGIMANEFIKDINNTFHTNILPANIVYIAERDPLVSP